MFRGNYIISNVLQYIKNVIRWFSMHVLPVISAVWFSPHSTRLTLPLLKCSTTLGKRDSNMKVPWPSCPNWPRPNEYTSCSALPDVHNIQSSQKRKTRQQSKICSPTCKCHCVPSSTGYLYHFIRDAGHLLRHFMIGQLLCGQAQLPTVLFSKCKQGPIHCNKWNKHHLATSQPSYMKICCHTELYGSWRGGRKVIMNSPKSGDLKCYAGITMKHSS